MSPSLFPSPGMNYINDIMFTWSYRNPLLVIMNTMLWSLCKKKTFVFSRTDTSYAGNHLEIIAHFPILKKGHFSVQKCTFIRIKVFALFKSKCNVNTISKLVENASRCLTKTSPWQKTRFWVARERGRTGKGHTPPDAMCPTSGIRAFAVWRGKWFDWILSSKSYSSGKGKAGLYFCETWEFFSLRCDLCVILLTV